MWSKREPKVAPLALLTAQVPVKDFVLLAQPALSLWVNQFCSFREESQRKRYRAESKSGTRKRGRPRKAEPAPLLPAVLEGAAAGTQEDPAVVVAPEPAAAFISDQLYESLASFQASEPQLAPAPPAPMLQSVYVKSAVDLDPLPGPVDPAPVTDPGLSQDSTAGLAPLLAPPQVETLYTESQGREAPEQVLIEDLGPDEEEDVSPTQDQRPDEGMNHPSDDRLCLSG